ncbi:hypothetical protein H8356DRAFT_1333505 [Neocallimastix lanati (nom. inval.)]|nr:hypothetical protein H8356DRAFT_1333505 [Neocallimastix sp. JGI-2020a]
MKNTILNLQLLFENLLKPLIDGSTENIRTKPITYPMCTIGNTARIPEHFIEYASVVEFPTQGVVKIYYSIDCFNKCHYFLNQVLVQLPNYYICKTLKNLERATRPNLKETLEELVDENE